MADLRLEPSWSSTRGTTARRLQRARSDEAGRAGTPRPGSTPVGEVMTKDVSHHRGVAPASEEAMEAMQTHSCRHLPVTCDGACGRFPFHARPDELRAGAQNRGNPSHARIYQQRVTTGIIVFAHGSRIESANEAVRVGGRGTGTRGRLRPGRGGLPGTGGARAWRRPPTGCAAQGVRAYCRHSLLPYTRAAPGARSAPLDGAISPINTAGCEIRSTPPWMATRDWSAILRRESP